MPGNSTTYHEPVERLSSEIQDQHRAIASLMEELEAIDWYQQRAEVCADDELRSVLLHNRNEEIEHASMVLEWIRRHNAKFDEALRVYLFTEGPIVAIEKSAEGKAVESGGSPAGDRAGGAAAPRSLGIGSLRTGE
ncbi:MAG: ferritin-like domain-containing protein [Thermodesulfobacteriota bacterium]